MSAKDYTFVEIARCNMCHAPVSTAKVLGKRLNRSQGVRPTRLTGITTTVMKCRRCSLIFSNPMPVPRALSQHYGVPPEEYWTQSYFDLTPDYFTSQIQRYYELSGKQSGAGLSALDIGAGVGKCMKALERAGFEAHGIEPSSPFFERALSSMGVPPDRITLVSIEEAVLPADRFDFITFGAVLEHLFDPAGAIERALAWAKPGGFVHIEVPSSRWLTNKIANCVYRVQGLDYVSNISPMHNPFHLYEFGLDSFRHKGRLLGCEIAHYEYMVCNTYLPRAIDFIIKPLMSATDSGMQLEVWLRKEVSAPAVLPDHAVQEGEGMAV